VRRAARPRLACALACLAALAATAAGAPPEDEFALGVRLCDEGRMAEALPIYERITKSHPFYAFGWLGLGWSLHYTGRPAEAIPAYEKAIELGATQPHQPMIEIARCYAALGRRAEAVAWVERALASGLPSVDRLRRDERLASLRSDPGFRRLAAIVDVGRMSRAEGWRYDLALLEREIARVHYAWDRHFTRAELAAAVAAVRRSVPRLDDDRLAVEVMRIARRLGDGHTYAEPPFVAGGREREIPVLVDLFDDGLYVTAVAPGLEDLLWARVVAVEGGTPERALAALYEVVGQDNPYRLKSRGPELLRNPRLLKALGVARGADAAEWRVVDRSGRERAVRLEAVPPSDVAWVRRPPGHAGELPLSARNRAAYYWFEYLPGSRALYFQYNAVAESADETPEAFAERLSRALEEDRVERLVVDLRWNGGGNVFLSRPILGAILTSKKASRRGRLFVIAGRHTFSAAMIFAAQLERYTPAIFVGEPTGSSPNFVGETNFLTLPYSGVRVSLSNLYWQTSHAKDTRTWISPRIVAPPTFESLESGRDPALEAALAWDAGR
jgi:tetratricopeptide (TPR) repeat protein